MDYSNIYVEMCNHPLIQEQWERLEGDYFYGKGWWGFAKVMILFDANSCCAVLPQEDAIWRPRQDQIQEMMGGGGKCGCTVCLVTGLYNFMENNLEGMFEAGIEGTMELLWLAYYMSEKHNLIWDGGEWKDNG